MHWLPNFPNATFVVVQEEALRLLAALSLPATAPKMAADYVGRSDIDGRLQWMRHIVVQGAQAAAAIFFFSWRFPQRNSLRPCLHPQVWARRQRRLT